jgi:drug/metabolite transporter (DMT)-like permease
VAFSGKALLLGLVAGALGIMGARALLLSVQGSAGQLVALAAPLAPILLAVALHVARTESLNLWIAAALLVGFAGVVVGMGGVPSLDFFGEPTLALVFVAAVLAIASLFGLGKPLVETNGVMGAVALVSLGAAAAAAALSPDAALTALDGVVGSFDAFFWFATDVLLTTILGYGLLFQGLKSVPAVGAAASLFLAPVAVTAWHAWDGALGFRTPSGMEMAGGIMALAACAILASRQRG